MDKFSWVPLYKEIALKLKEFKGRQSELLKILIDLNQQIFNETPSYIFVTFFIGIIDGTTHEIEYCSAGHMKPMVYRYKKDDIEILDGGGIPIGMDDQDFFTDTIITRLEINGFFNTLPRMAL